ncbi:MAG: AAA family ATPase, partial [Leptospira sp.]|nr:AAA family ATPase [Leptospira sp.]
AKELLIERISVDPDLFSGAGRGKRKIVFFVGPTGSGKTTTIAKLAAKYYLHMGRAVSLYTTDNYRIAAIEQLKRYADTMDIPFYAVKEIKKFREALLRDGSELILIDTAGYSHRNAEFYSKMKAYEEAFSEKDEVENILVISGTSSYSNTKSVMNAYEETGYKRVILTKLDETDYVGSFLELADKYSKTFAYFSTGQEVPFDIASTDKKLFAEIVINPEKIKEIKGESFASVN